MEKTMARKGFSLKLFTGLQILLLTLSLTVGAQNPGAVPQEEKSKPLPAAQYIPSHDFDTQNIVLNLRFDWKSEEAIGTEALTFSPLVKNLRTVMLDAANMTIGSVALQSGSQLQFAQDEAHQKLSISLDRFYQPGESQTLLIVYHTNGTAATKSINGGGGLSFIQPTKGDPTRPRQIWSQGESVYAHYWYPCYDSPNDFFTSEIVATVEKPLSVISNGRLVNTRDNTDGTRTFDWKIEQPHASYLTSIVVGEYVPVGGEYEGIPVQTYVYSNEVEAGKVTSARLVDMVKFFSEKTGVKYPYAKYAQTVARDFNGGMENISATTQTDQMIHDARTELDKSSDSIQSHELAHQWFGDLITCRTWADIWLNESFATYFQALWDEQHLGHDDFLSLDVGNNQKDYLQAWQRGQRRPIVTKNYSNPDAVFDTYAYPRGGAVLHMLRKYLGDDNWWRAIHYYLTKYAHQPVETEQFRIAIEESTGQSMDRFFDQWLYRMGHPVFSVSQKYDSSSHHLLLTVRQEQKPDTTTSYPQVTYFETPVDIEIGTANKTRVERVKIEPKEEQTFTFDVDSDPLLVDFDYESTLIKELKFEKTTTALIYQLSHDRDVMGRFWALGELKEKLSNDSLDTNERAAISSAIEASVGGDQYWGMRSAAATDLAGIAGSQVRDCLVAGTKDNDARVRVAAVKALAATNDPSLAGLYENLLSDKSYAVIRAAAKGLGATKAPSAYARLRGLAGEPSWHGTIAASALAGLAELGDKRAMNEALRYARANEPDLRAQALRLLGRVGKGDPRTFDLIAQGLIDSAETASLTVSFAASGALVELGDPRGADLIARVRKGIANADIQETLLQQEAALRQKSTSAGPGGERQN
jgi:aminopeptidase N